MKSREEIRKENVELENEVGRLQEWNAKRERDIRAKLKRKIEGGLQRQRDLKRQVVA